ncbi:PREDICTED: HAUS augmin-like complex subunit 8 [Nanorana parkeri]|uniref:HAUS augmin-like complex subunit 8 n=1 Tax=Nanorana parkeri TaxID=125878 RepID=UPI0008543F41|nr:PREDICTED: HAUS augmin-like complex subunit 8 [Nanorana parkeri]
MAGEGEGMAETGSGSQNSSGASSGDTALKKKKAAPKMVKSRYMQYDKPKAAKKPNVENSTLSSAGKAPDRGGNGTPTRRSVVPQRLKAPSAINASVADGNLFRKEDLQSTLLDGHKYVLPELDFSVINDKTLQKLTPKSSSTSEQRKLKRETAPVNNAPTDVIDMYESQTLLFTHLTLKMEKNIKRLEEKAERNLLLAIEERNRLQEKVYQLKHDLSLTRNETQLNDLLKKQAEGLVPSSAAMKQFKDSYTSFATAVDCTRHQLPINNIHVVGTRQRYLDNIQKHLSATKTLVEEAIPRSCDESIDLLATIKSLEDIALKTDTELSRSLHQILDLSSKVNKEMSLQSQKLVEENCEVDVMKQWYFDQAIS